MAVTQIPMFKPTVAFNHKFRFAGLSTAAGVTISGKNLLNLLLVGSSTTTSARLLEGIKIKRLQIWLAPAVLGANAMTSISVEWFGYNAPSTVVSDTAIGVVPAKLDTRPPKSATASMWATSGGMLDSTAQIGQLFTIIGTNSTLDIVIDLTCECSMVESESPTAGDVPAGAVAGQVYGNYLDGLATANWGQVGYTPLP